jgi:acyl carrier protein phosphodiesterase
MNLLAHAYLSFEDPEILVGNMISDFVKGRRKFDYPIHIQNGIALHRRIDEFTDEHLTNRELKLIFKPQYGLYASPIIDVIHDHFLANDNDSFTSKEDLISFSQNVYDNLDPFEHLFPEKFARMFPYMREQNWLYHYRFMEGVRSSLGGLQRRAKYLTEMDTAFRLLQENYATLKAGFNEFFPQLKEMSLSEFNDMRS